MSHRIAQPSLSDEQKLIFRPGSILVQACPGSGKTRAIIARYVRGASISNKGVALLSFTNRAVDEARSRCASEPHLLESPNFTGTFDTFLHNFIVTPHIIRTQGIVPRYLRSWNDLDSRDHYIRIYGGPHGPGVSLSSFIWSGDGLALQRLKHPESNYYAWVEKENRQGIFFAAAKRKMDRFLSEGVFDSNAARHLAHQILTSQRGSVLIQRLAIRFHEIIVDEFQDCDEHEHAILGLLADAGINIVAVADPDQSIYEFRGARPDLIATYSQKLGPDQIVSFGTNYRSTPAICALATSLRAATPTVISPCGSPPRVHQRFRYCWETLRNSEPHSSGWQSSTIFPFLTVLFSLMLGKTLSFSRGRQLLMTPELLGAIGSPSRLLSSRKMDSRCRPGESRYRNLSLSP